MLACTGTTNCAWSGDSTSRNVTADACVFPGSTWSRLVPESAAECQAAPSSVDSNDSQPSLQGTTLQQLKPLPVIQPTLGSVAQGTGLATQTEVTSQQSVLSSMRMGEKDLTHSKILLCEYCDASFTSSGGLWLHKASEHFKRKFVCNICGKVLKRKENLINHMKTHNSPHAQECPVCHVYFGPKDFHFHNCAKSKDKPSSS